MGISLAFYGQPRDVILIHDGIQQTVDVLPQILEYLKDQGYKTVTIDEMMGEG